MSIPVSGLLLVIPATPTTHSVDIVSQSVVVQAPILVGSTENVKRTTLPPPSPEAIPNIPLPEKPDVVSAPSEVFSAGASVPHVVPFYSQFADITEPSWQKVGCGIASIAMLIDYYTDTKMNVDELLQEGINAGSFLPDAGWTHAGLVNLTKPFGLDGASHSLSHLSMDDALAELQDVVSEGPVMVSVHYTFDRNNPIPHLAVITGIDDEQVYYNDPADYSGQRSISTAQFQSAWKKRYISIRPTT